jgi:mono/diheme cytochrome c family protein
MSINRTKRSIFTLIIALLTGLWAASLMQNISAHEGHRHAHAPASAKKLKNPLSATGENIGSGRTLFNKHCASCHGEDGKARTQIAANMKVKPSDLTNKAMKGITDGEIYWVVTNGITKSRMPAFKTKANDQERWRMTLYVKHLMGGHPHAGH